MNEEENQEELSLAWMVVLAMVFAPIITWAAILDGRLGLKDPEERPWAFIVAAGDLMYVSLGGAMALYGKAVGAVLESKVAEIAAWASQFDPHLVWEPWQALILAIVASLLLLLMGYRGMVIHGYD